jgi:hypothetical protein
MTNLDEQKERTEHLLNIDMHYRPGRNNYETGKLRRDYTIKICARMNIVAPMLIKTVYGISHRLALLHLNKLVAEGYLTLFKTPRAIDGRLYVLTHIGASYASELLETSIPFRSQSEPSRQINHSSISHDLMNAYVLLRGVNHVDKNGNHQPLWNGFLTEREFARLYTANSIRNVDGIVRETNEQQTIAAIEVENSFKTKAMRQTILLKLLHSLNLNVYEKVFVISQQQKIFDDIKRFHKQLFEELVAASSNKNMKYQLSDNDVNILKRSIIFRTKFCDERQKTFYP